jgi:hypothetical protein
MDKVHERGGGMNGFLRALEEQRWDDHRYYHHSRINQSLHLLSALSFLASYALVFVQPAGAALVGWLLAMLSRQVGHFFFEPKGYDEANQVTHEYKEQVKVGYNLRRKVVLLTIWALSPLAVVASPTLGGLLEAPADLLGYVNNVSALWIAIGVGAVLFRTAHLFFIKDLQTGLVWLTKIVTDPFHDIKLYHRAPLHVLRGDLLEPIGPAARSSL